MINICGLQTAKSTCWCFCSSVISDQLMHLSASMGDSNNWTTPAVTSGTGQAQESYREMKEYSLRNQYTASKYGTGV